jgi:hypothetical protein
MTNINYRFPEGFVSDRLFDIIHEVYRVFSPDPHKSVVIGGSFALNAQGAIKRKVSALDLCVARWDYSNVVDFMSRRAGADSDSTDENFSSFVIDGFVNVCLFKHESFDGVDIRTMNLHGEIISLFPAERTMEYKLDSLNRYFARLPANDAEVLKHFSDILYYIREKNCSKIFEKKFTNYILDLKLYGNLTTELEKLLTTEELQLIEEHSVTGSKYVIDPQLLK